jgi:hypothetical protein
MTSSLTTSSPATSSPAAGGAFFFNFEKIPVAHIDQVRHE